MFKCQVNDIWYFKHIWEISFQTKIFSIYIYSLDLKINKIKISTFYDYYKILFSHSVCIRTSFQFSN